MALKVKQECETCSLTVGSTFVASTYTISLQVEDFAGVLKERNMKSIIKKLVFKSC